MVVLEDADADLMPAERDAVQRALGALTAGRTALISSREPETILDADRVLCFEAGALAEDGAPAELADDPDSWLAVWLHTTAETPLTLPGPGRELTRGWPEGVTPAPPPSTATSPPVTCA